MNGLYMLTQSIVVQAFKA